MSIKNFVGAVQRKKETIMNNINFNLSGVDKITQKGVPNEEIESSKSQDSESIFGAIGSSKSDTETKNIDDIADILDEIASNPDDIEDILKNTKNKDEIADILDKIASNPDDIEDILKNTKNKDEIVDIFAKIASDNPDEPDELLPYDNISSGQDMPDKPLPDDSPSLK